MILSYRINSQEHKSWKSTYLPLMTSCGKRKKGKKDAGVERGKEGDKEYPEESQS